MNVVVPDDPVFLAKFNEIERPLLHELCAYYLPELPAAQADLIKAAYDCWDEIHRRLPPVLKWQALPPDGAPPAQGGYELHDPLGRRLTCLYVVKVSVRQLDVLRSCHDTLTWAEETADATLADVLSGLQRAPENQGKHLLDSFRRVLEVMELRAAPILVASLERVTPAGPEAPVVAMTLDADQYTAYRELCDQIVYALSTGDDEFTYQSHRMLYAS
ncbi:hypothetical protein ACWD0J_10270 [Streptomyces sp. NPDC003011]